MFSYFVTEDKDYESFRSKAGLIASAAAMPGPHGLLLLATDVQAYDSTHFRSDGKLRFVSIVSTIIAFYL